MSPSLGALRGWPTSAPQRLTNRWQVLDALPMAFRESLSPGERPLAC